MTENHPNAKVLFRVECEDGEADVETLWAYKLGQDLYKLDNSPFYAYAVSWQDVVYAPYDEIEQFATSQRVVEKSGNRTIRIIFDPPVESGNESDRVLKALKSMGCSLEGANSSYMAINIPPNVDLDQVRGFLLDSGAEWEHADPTYEQLFGSTD